MGKILVKILSRIILILLLSLDDIQMRKHLQLNPFRVSRLPKNFHLQNLFLDGKFIALLSLSTIKLFPDSSAHLPSPPLRAPSTPHEAGLRR
jgi:hypothetical protein